MPEAKRLLIPLILAAISMAVYGVGAVVMTVLLFVGVLAAAVILGHAVSKNLFSKYKWDVGAKINHVFDAAEREEDHSTQARVAIAILYARTAVLISVILGLILLAGLLLPRNATGACSTKPAISNPVVSPSAIGATQKIPARAAKYLPILQGEHNAIWPESNICIVARQIEHESAWKENATRRESSGAMSYGQMQVLDSTWGEIKGKYPTLLSGEPQVMLQAKWGIRAGLLYDLMMWNASRFAATEQDRYCFMLASYNGGQGWVERDRKLTEQSHKNKNVWFGGVESYSNRSTANYKINRKYVREIMSNAKNYAGVLQCP